jgi:hypothetical protein
VTPKGMDVKSNNAEATDSQQQRDTGWGPHPDYSSYSDAYLDLEQGTVQDKIGWAKEDGDELRAIYFEDRMRLLNAERGRRNGGANSFPHLGDRPCGINSRPKLGGNLSTRNRTAKSAPLQT